jgi:hypothetical protein
MAEERPQHTQEPAEGSDEDVGVAGAERAGETDKAAEGPQPSQHSQEPAEGSEEDVEKTRSRRSQGQRVARGLPLDGPCDPVDY